MPKSSRYTATEVKAMLERPKGRVRNVAPRADRTYAGRVYHSKAEAVHAFGLDQKKSAGIIYWWAAQRRLPIFCAGKFICDVVLDFGIQDHPGDLPRYEEIKGWETPEWKLKKKLLLACYPDIKLEVIKA